MPQLGERGAVTAEFAVALPAVLLVLALGAGVLGSVATTVRAQQMTAEAARLLGRGDGGALARLAEIGADASVNRGGGVVCVRASLPVPFALPLPPASARACALDGGR
ncbi:MULTISPECIES: TadE family protein [Microbacterium]|uniref:TadE family protein n=1 Tax=Microbacterium testaceum TaxID=2033 RepID=A0A4Y3QJ81_MICTE|nr:MULTISPECIES: TadE family protein [Microbacterium]MDZ5144561.1 TadE family protein [Microbacterium testaceum]PNW10570.1 TadE family protein [Microbacterium testaceum]REC98440.1 hypothetical protein DEU35_1545 [Microbacterium sp. AG157]WJS90028.1 TadE family protein [Microbacterium testaceum]GEB45162.1 hypothetical protein MTE01_11070 [Microbacterium testaceum]